MKKTSPLTPGDILADHSPRVCSLVNKLRQIIKSTIPEAEERAYPVWHGIGFRHPKAGYFCGVFPYEDSVKIYFEYGKFLPDPDGLFTGSGKQTGQILLRKMNEIKMKPLQLLLRESVEVRWKYRSSPKESKR